MGVDIMERRKGKVSLKWGLYDDLIRYIGMVVLSESVKIYTVVDYQWVGDGAVVCRQGRYHLYRDKVLSRLGYRSRRLQ